ncbi:MAG: nitroreductase family deazaflavin-dependent oxidoreductase [Chloroflexi bacterium]|nr:nitroreductase family deazaflavin-dependent oxidoreductase [Chloroflexota bacterium]
MADVPLSDREIVEEFRRSGGTVSGFAAGVPLMLLTTMGRRSGKRHTVPVVYSRDGDRLILVAANAGSTKNPDWYYNVLAHPDATVELGSDTLEVTASVVEGELRDRIVASTRAAWKFAQAKFPGLPVMPPEAERHIPVIALTPRRRIAGSSSSS